MRRTKLYGKGVNNRLPKGLNWEHIENIPRQEGRKVVKGTSKRVVVVKSPNPKFFEQAIFILREDIKESRGGSDVLREAQRVADDYVKNYVSEEKNFFAKMPPTFFAAVGALAGAIISLVICFTL